MDSEGDDTPSDDCCRSRPLHDYGSGLLHDNRGRLLDDDRLRLGSCALRGDDVADKRRARHGGSGNGQSLKQATTAAMMVVMVDGHGMMMMMMEDVRMGERENAARANDDRDCRENLSVELVHDLFLSFARPHCRYIKLGEPANVF